MLPIPTRMNHQPSPPVASSSRLPPIQTQLNPQHAFDDQAAAAAAALLQIKRSPSSAHPPLLPHIQDFHGPFSLPDIDGPSNAGHFQYLPPIRTDFHRYRPSPQTGSTPSPYFPYVPQPHPYPPSFQHHHGYPSNSPRSSPPSHPPAPPPRKRKRSSAPTPCLPEPQQRVAPPSFNGARGHHKERELRIDVEGDADPEIDVDDIAVDGEDGIVSGDPDGEGEVRCICGFDVDDGFTIQCEKCHVWQHAACFSIPDISATPEVYLCERCDPAPKRVDYEGARRMQQERLEAEMGLNRGSVGGGAARKRGRGGPGSLRAERRRGATRKRASSSAQHPHPHPHLHPDSTTGRRASGPPAARRKDKEKEPSPFMQPLPASRSPDPPHPPEADAQEPWTEQYVPIATDIVHPSVRSKLRAFAHAWRGVTAFSSAAPVPDPEPLSPLTTCTPLPAPASAFAPAPAPSERTTVLHPLPPSLAHPSRPPTYTLHALRPIARRSYVVPYTCAITPSAAYLREPTSQYAQLGVPKQGVHLVPPPLALCLDARGVGGEGRWVRSGCHPNAVLRPVVCGAGKKRGEDGDGDGCGDGEEEGGDEVTFGVFAIRDLKADEEIVLGWEWDDRHVVHELPRLLKEGYASGGSGLKRAMGEVLSTLFSTFTTCACGASAHDCAIAQMHKVADLHADPDPDSDVDHASHDLQHVTSHERRQAPPSPPPPPDLGPLIGATRGMRTMERGQGGREGVELLSPPSVSSVARAFRGVGGDVHTPRHVHFPAPDLIVSPATSAASPRKTWERQYSATHSSDSSDGELEARPARKKARRMPRIDSSPPVEDVRDEALLEETLPPKMRKNWIKETLRELNDDLGADMDVDVDEQVKVLSVDLPPVPGRDTMEVELKSPSTALAGLSLQNPTRPRASPSRSPASLTPNVSPSTPALTLSSPENIPPPSSHQTTKSKSPKTPSRSPTRSPARSPSATDRRASPVTSSKPAAPHVAPLLPSSAANANPTTPLPVPSPPLNAATTVPATSERLPDPPPLPCHEPIIEPIPEPPPPPPPKKPPVKRSTLADWKIRKEKERKAQALLQPPPQSVEAASADDAAPLDPPVNPVIATTLSPLPSEKPSVPNQGSTQESSALKSEDKAGLDGSDERGDMTDALEYQLSKADERALSPEHFHRLSSPTPDSPPLSDASPSLSTRILGLRFDHDARVLPRSLSSPISEDPTAHAHRHARKASLPASHEDGEIATDVGPSQLPSLPSSRPPSRPPSRARSPPTHPRSFRAVSPTPSLTRSSPPSRPRGIPPPRNHSSDFHSDRRSRPVPSGPRALRNGLGATGLPASTSPYSGRSYGRSAPSSRGGFYSSTGPSERESDQGWTTRGRGRGRGGNGPGGGGRSRR